MLKNRKSKLKWLKSAINSHFYRRFSNFRFKILFLFLRRSVCHFDSHRGESHGTGIWGAFDIDAAQEASDRRASVHLAARKH